VSDPVVLVDQPSAAPTRKVFAGGIAGAITTLFIGSLKMAGLELPIEMACAVLVIVQFAVAYFTRDEAQPGTILPIAVLNDKIPSDGKGEQAHGSSLADPTSEVRRL